jgi:hypothetical protein
MMKGAGVRSRGMTVELNIYTHIAKVSDTMRSRLDKRTGKRKTVEVLYYVGVLVRLHYYSMFHRPRLIETELDKSASKWALQYVQKADDTNLNKFVSSTVCISARNTAVWRQS